MKPIGMRPQPVLSLALLALFAALMSGAQKPPAPAEKAGGPAREIASPAAAAPVPKTAVQDAALFERDVVPIFAAHCFKCHGLEARKADLDLRTPALIERGGKTGPPVVPGSAEKSLLFQKVSTAAMPPGNEIKLSAEQIGILRRWIDGGARAARAYGSLTKAEAPPVTAQDRMFWSFRKPVEPPLPRVRGRNRVRAPIDRFLLAKLEEKGLTFSKDTDRATLIRRASFDLTGLPPAPGEVDAFVADSSPGAYERLLDRLLASPHFGERWGRHWLDAAGYADTMGGDNDAGITKVGQGKWRYRDYVVRSLNQDKPWDQFLTEQIAGDELVDWRSAKKYTPEIQEKLIATGFLRTAYDDTDENELNTADLRLAVVQRLISNLSGSVLGLTVGCAQCHTHKYDPIPQRDYYQIMAIFSPAYNHQSWLQPKDRLMVEVSPGEKAEIDRHNAEIDRQIEPLKKQVAAIRQAHENRLLDEKLLQAPEEIRLEIKAALKTPREKRSMLDKFLLDKFEKKVKVAEDEVTAAFSPEEKARIASLEADMKPYEVKRAALGNIHAGLPAAPRQSPDAGRRGSPRLSRGPDRAREALHDTGSPGGTSRPARRLSGGGRHWPPARLRALADGPRFSRRRAGRPRGREPRLAALVRRRHGRHSGQLRPLRRPAGESRAARLADGRIFAPGLAFETADPAHHDLYRLPPVFGGRNRVERRRRHLRGPGQQAAVAHAPAAA